ncbi:hypothetical protein K469DRAFT_810043 [Zopfia rhizophila CBS 207.26]|uniref:WD40 repeat-like protein n=1 Tax=Zopfia rhizophila CBS 207.26 TaxID=1314779 RepID=A0A6A6DDG7_9PEZI|nr:hypothetical protein K469DRAFT_810043 [Zopfia rhizophila CBS 207.26]
MPTEVASPKNKSPSRSIRHFVCSKHVIIAVVHVAKTRWVYHLKENQLQPLVLLEESTPVVLALALSPDGTTIALGCGDSTLVYRTVAGEVYKTWKLPRPNDLNRRAVRVHKLNFSVDSRRLISCIQVEGKDNSDKHAVPYGVCPGYMIPEI